MLLDGVLLWATGRQVIVDRTNSPRYSVNGSSITVKKGSEINVAFSSYRKWLPAGKSVYLLVSILHYRPDCPLLDFLEMVEAAEPHSFYWGCQLRLLTSSLSIMQHVVYLL